MKSCILLNFAEVHTSQTRAWSPDPGDRYPGGCNPILPGHEDSTPDGDDGRQSVQSQTNPRLLSFILWTGTQIMGFL